MSYYLGIDGGGSKTACVVADETQVLGAATAGGSNIVRLGEETARANLHAVIQEACTLAHIRPTDIDSAVIGVAGAASVAEFAAAIRRIVSEIGVHDIEVVGDNVIAIEGAFAGLPGVVVIAGTGSIAFGRNQRGETARAGGYGFAISDEGSGHWIGRNIVAAAMRAYDIGQSELLDAIATTWHVSGRDELVQKSNGEPRPDFAQLFPMTVELATRGHALAQSVLHEAGRELAGLAATVIRKLWQERKPVRVALGGGVFAHSPQVRKSFYLCLRELHPAAAVNFRIIDPLAGALWLARRSGVKVK
jgi:N-acetylglucosamine kinase-like BadF-type ATPase